MPCPNPNEPGPSWLGCWALVWAWCWVLALALGLACWAGLGCGINRYLSTLNPSFAPSLPPLGNLGNELADNRIAKGFEILCHHVEGAGSADDLGAVIMIEPAGRVGVLRIPQQRSFAQDRESIDRDSLRHGLIAQFGHIAAGIVGAVTGNIDGLAARAKWRPGELDHSELDGAADRGAIGERPRRFQQAIAEIFRRCGIADRHPINDGALRADPGPLDEGQSDPAIAAGANGIEDPRVGDRGGIAVALQL